MMMKIRILIFVLISSVGFAQRNSEKADRYFNQNQFETAIKYYLIDVNSDSKKAKEYAMAKLADCYRIIGEFEKAEDIYRKILKRKKTIPENYLNYGLSLKSSAKYAEAKLQFEEYIKLKPEDLMGKIYLQSCDSAQKWLDETIGKEVKNIESLNTPFSDFGSYINKGKLFFSSSRVGSTKAFISFEGGNDVPRMDLYKINLSELFKKDFNPKNIENINQLNTPLHEGTPTFSSDGNEMYFTKTVKGTKNEKNNNVLNVLQIYCSKKDSLGNWSTPVSAFNFNSKNYSVGHPSLSADGLTIFFMSDMPGGFGKTDIYYSTRTPGNKIWTKPKNLGKDVNTFGYELFPAINTLNILYFSSNTHPGMGQLDIFKTELINGIWTNTQNLKPPINSIANDFSISFDESQDKGFFSSDRFNGKGLEDIYCFSFDEPINLTLLNESICFNNSFIYDDTKYKITNLTDSVSTDLSTDSLSYNIKLEPNKSYSISLKKNGMPLGKIQVNHKTKNEKLIYLITLDKIPVKIKGELSHEFKKITMRDNNNKEEIKCEISGSTFETKDRLNADHEYLIEFSL